MKKMSLFAKEIFALVEKRQKDTVLRGVLVRALNASMHSFYEEYYFNGMQNLKNAIYNIEHDKLLHNLRSSKCGKFVVYTSKNKEVKTKLLRYLIKYFKVDKLDLFSHIHYFIDMVISGVVGAEYIDNNIKYLTGNAIVAAYKREGNTFKSCMGGRRGGLTKIYALNPKKVCLVVFKEHEARALLWTTDNGTKILDRVYPSGSTHTAHFKAWAIAKGYVFRNHLDGHVSSSNVSMSDGHVHKITLTTPEKGFFPYMDSFRHGVGVGPSIIRIQNMGNDNYCCFIKMNSMKGMYRKSSKHFKQLKCFSCRSTDYLSFDLERNNFYCDYHS